MIIKPNFREVDVFAVNALTAYRADENQQAIALEWIMRQACLFQNTAYSGQDGTHPAEDTLFNAGRQFVAEMIRDMRDPQTLERARVYDKMMKRGT